MHIIRTFLISLLVLGGLAACAGADASSPPEAAASSISVEARDHTYSLASGSSPIAAGVVPIRLSNQGSAVHQAVVARLPEGMSVSSYLAAEPPVRWVGGVNGVEPGSVGVGWADLRPGRYVLLCFIATPEGVQHLHEGMAQELEVVDAGARAAAPSSVATVALDDFSITLPSEGLGRPGVYRFTNSGAEPHEVILIRLREGKTLADAAAYQASGSVGPAPYTFVGGPGVVSPGGTMYARLSLSPGSYVALCMITGEHNGQPHLAMGMVRPFTVD